MVKTYDDPIFPPLDPLIYHFFTLRGSAGATSKPFAGRSSCVELTWLDLNMFNIFMIHMHIYIYTPISLSTLYIYICVFWNIVFIYVSHGTVHRLFGHIWPLLVILSYSSASVMPELRCLARKMLTFRDQSCCQLASTTATTAMPCSIHHDDD